MSSGEETDRRYLLRKYNNNRVMIVSDLHLGFEAEWSDKGLDTREPHWSYKIIDQLKNEVSKTNPNQLLILGDLEHSFIHFKSSEKDKERIWVSNRWLREKTLHYFMEQIVKIDSLKVSLIRGNQDTSFLRSLEKLVKIYPQGAELFGQLGVWHGHTRPSAPILFSSEIMLGHVHPAIELIDELKIQHKYPVFVKLTVSREEIFHIFDFQLELEEIGLIDEVTITILPAYNKFLGGFTLNQRKKKYQSYPVLSQLLQHPKLRIHLTNGIDLGLLADL
ncbi:MAG: metallophosphoesterase [Candidatus Heimdallarchaeota archaeon]|nr:MAG: metallophosphoesterase [Candidatus Heimdallarchaeota archaeon]